MSGSFRKYAFVDTNDPRRHRVRMSLTMQIVPPVAVRPGTVTLHGLTGHNITEEVLVTNHEPAPLHLELQPSTLDGSLVARIETLEDGRQFKVVIRNTRINPGNYYGRLILKTSSPDMATVKLKIIGRIRPHRLPEFEDVAARN